MPTRREFVGSVLAGAATLAVTGPFATRRVLGANDRIRIGLIGAGVTGAHQQNSDATYPDSSHGFSFFTRTATVRFSSVKYFFAASWMSLGAIFSIISTYRVMYR